MRGLSQQLAQSLADPAGKYTDIVFACVEGAADIRQRADQWAQADGGLSSNLEVLADGGLRLKATAGAAVGPTTANAWFRAKESGLGGPYIDPFYPSSDDFVCVLGQWTGTAANVSYGSVQAWLNPRFDTTKPKYVQTWELILYQLGVGTVTDPVTGRTIIGLAPVARAQVRADGEAAGWVVFPLQDASGKATPWHPEPWTNPLNPIGQGIGTLFTPQYLLVCHGYDAKGQKATNIAWGYDNANTTFVSGAAPNQVSLFARTVSMPIIQPFKTGELLFGSVAPAGMPALQFVPVSYASSATLTFKTTAPFDLGATPSAAALVEFVLKPETPIGTTVLGEVAQDPAGGFVTMKDGQDAGQLGLAAQRKYDGRLTLTASAAGDRTPIVRLFGPRVVAKTDMGPTTYVSELNERTDPLTHQSEIETCVVRGIHNGERDYRDVISRLLAQNPPGTFYFRIYIGDRQYTRDLWCHHDDYFPRDVDLQDGYSDIACASVLSQLKQAMPVLTSDAVLVPIADSSNPGSWTASSGSVLYPQIADTPEPPWAGTTAYLVGQRVIDANGKVQACTVAGTSGGSAPTWATVLGAITIDATVTWQNLGPTSSGLPDDKTYIQSPTNPSNADYVATLSAIGVPQQSVGAMIQFRAATVGAAQSLTCVVQIRSASTVRAQKSVTVNVQDTGPGSYQIFQYALTAAEQAAITSGDWGGGLNVLIRANGTGGVRVGWVRFLVLGRRVPYDTSTISTQPGLIMADIINNVLALDGRLKGPQYSDPSPSLSVTKRIEQDPSGSTDLQRAYDELTRLAWITGGFFMSTQGRLTYRPFYQVTTGTDLITGTTTAQYLPLVGPIRAILAPGEVEPISITPGWRQRIPLYQVAWGWNGQNWAGEAQVVNAPALTYYHQELIETEVRCPTETSKWISGQGLANGLSARHGQSFGLGLMEWRFRCIYPHPEWERGDVITIPTDRFLAYDPISTRAMAGKMWATGVIIGRHDVHGREWSIWIQSLAAIRPIAGQLTWPPFSSQSPLSLGVSGYVGEAPGTSAGDNLNVFWAGTPAVAAVKIAVSTSSPPAAGTGTLFVGNQGTALMVGPYAFGTTIYVTITPYATVDGTQAAGVAAIVVKLIDGSSISTPYNVQGSTLPTPVRNMDFRFSAGGAANGHMWVVWQWAVNPIEDKTFYRPDGSTVNLKQPMTQIPNVVPPTLAQVAGGALGARTRYVRTALVKDGVLYMGRNFPVSGESSLAISANNLLKVTSPAPVAGFDGWCPLVGTNVSQEVTQPGTFATPIAFGTDWTEPVGGAQTSSATNTLYGQSSQWDFGAVVFVELNVSTDYFFYPYYDPILGFTRWLFEAPLSGAKAAVQYGDGNYPLTNGSLKGTTPIATGTNTGSAPTGGGTGGNVKILT